MATIVTRSGKGSPLTNTEVDSNFSNLNSDKAELSGAVFTGAITTNSTFDGRDVAADGAKADAALPRTGGAMTGAITTNSTFDGVDVAARDGVLSATATTANAALPKSGGAVTGAITTNSTFDGVDIATRDGVLSTTTTTANAALPKTGGAMTGAITTNSTIDGRDVAADGLTADAALPKTGGAMTGAITTNSTFDGRDVAADGVTADAALPKSGGAMTGAITTNSTFDGVDIATRDAVLTSTTTTANNALANVVEDTSPQLGGDLDGQGKDVTNVGILSADTFGGIYGSSSAPSVFAVTVASKTAGHPYNGDGSGSAYFLNGVESPAIQLSGADNVTSSTGYYYKFDQSNSSNSGHPLLFYYDAAKTTAFTSGVTTSGTAGNAGAHTTISVDADTPNILYYQCSAHAYMGNVATAITTTIGTTAALKVPSGSTAQRPSSGVAGMFRYSSTLAAFEGYTTEWGEIGGGGSTDISLNTFTGDGSDLTFSLSAVAAENNTFVYIDGVYQNKSTYAVSAADPAVVTFSTAPPNGTAIEIMVAAISVSNIGTPSDNTVSTAKIVNGAVTSAKIASVPIAVGITSVVTATSLTATVNTHVYVSAATQTITLPASPTIGQRVLITVGNFADTVVGRNGSNIMSSATNMTLNKEYLSIQFIFADATRGWVMS